MHDGLYELLEKRRDRVIATILGIKERDCDPVLLQSRRGQEASTKFRRTLLRELNDFVELCFDVMDSLDDDSRIVLNEEYLRKIDELHTDVRTLKRLAEV